MNEYSLPYREDVKVEDANKFLDEFLDENTEVDHVGFHYSVYETGSVFGIRTSIEKQRYEVQVFE